MSFCAESSRPCEGFFCACQGLLLTHFLRRMQGTNADTLFSTKCAAVCVLKPRAMLLAHLPKRRAAVLNCIVAASTILLRAMRPLAATRVAASGHKWPHMASGRKWPIQNDALLHASRNLLKPDRSFTWCSWCLDSSVLDWVPKGRPGLVGLTSASHGQTSRFCADRLREIEPKCLRPSQSQLSARRQWPIFVWDLLPQVNWGIIVGGTPTLFGSKSQPEIHAHFGIPEAPLPTPGTEFSVRSPATAAMGGQSGFKDVSYSEALPAKLAASSFTCFRRPHVSHVLKSPGHGHGSILEPYSTLQKGSTTVPSNPWQKLHTCQHVPGLCGSIENKLSLNHMHAYTYMYILCIYTHCMHVCE